MQTVTSKTFNQQASRLKAMAALEPVLITERGRPTHVLLDYDTYTQLSQLKAADPRKAKTLVDWLALPGDVAADDLDGLLQPSHDLPLAADLS